MKIRSKIAHSAYLHRMTINEMFLNQILESYNVLSESGSISKSIYPPALIEYFDKALVSAEIPVVEVLFNLNGNPAMKDRKSKLYRARELKKMGVKNIEDLGDEKMTVLFNQLIALNTKRAA